VALVATTLSACSSSLLGPEDARYQDLCTIYMSEADEARMTEVLRERLSSDQIQRCRPINLYVVKFGA
jgi:hypothetical protein